MASVASVYPRRLPPLPSIRDLVRMYRLTAIKHLSQNFLMDHKLCDKFVKQAGKLQGKYVCEVGPGPGNVTRSIIARDVRKLIVVEKDRRFKPMLEHLQEACDDVMDIVYGDVLNFTLENVLPEDVRVPWDGPLPHVHVIGNLPFNISTPLIVRWLRDMSERKNAWSYGRTPLTLTFQREVSERMVAQIRSDQRCRLSLMCQNWCIVKHLFTIPGRAFVPKPDVDVGIVKFIPLKRPVIDLPFTLVEKVSRCIFSFRQKYCRRGIQVLFPKSVQAEFTEAMFQLSDVDPTLRPFELSLEEVGRLCHIYNDICSKFPKIRSYEHRIPATWADSYEDCKLQNSAEI